MVYISFDLGKLDNIPIVTDSYKPASHYIALELGDVGIPDVVEEESYSILSSRSPSFVVITGRSPRAVYYGIVTLLAMNEDELGVPSGELNDGPRYMSHQRRDVQPNIG